MLASSRSALLAVAAVLVPGIAHAFGPGPGPDLLSTMIVGLPMLLLLVVPGSIAGMIVGPRRGLPPFRGALVGGMIGFAAALVVTTLLVASNVPAMLIVIQSGLLFLSVPAAIVTVVVGTIGAGIHHRRSRV